MEKEKRLKEIEERLKELRRQADFLFNLDYKEYSEFEERARPIMKSMVDLGREQRMLIDFELEDEVGPDDHLMTIEDFIDSCKCGAFIDYDGYGDYVKDNRKSNITIQPSDIAANCIRPEFTHVVWYNR